MSCCSNKNVDGNVFIEELEVQDLFAGDLTVTNGITTSNITINGTLQLASLSLTDLTVSNGITSNFVDTQDLIVDNGITTNDITINGDLTLTDLNLTDLTVTNGITSNFVDTQDLIVDNEITTNDMTINGDLTLTDLNLTDLTVSNGITSNFVNTQDLIVDGNVTIGVTTATVKLDVGGDIKLSRTSNISGFTNTLTIEGARNLVNDFSVINFDNLDSNDNEVNYTGASIRGNNTGSNDGELHFYTHNGSSLNKVIEIGISGNVGIGVNNPTEKLEVNGNGVFIGITSTDITSTDLTVSNGITANLIDTQDLTVDNNALIKGDLFLFDTNERIGSDGTDMTFDVGGTERMIIDSEGNVGIGTNTPDTPLYIRSDGSVEGDREVMITLRSDVSKKPAIKFSETATFGMFIEYDGLLATTENKMNIVSDTGLELVSFENGGNVGIGVTNPSQKLDVNGDVLVQGGDLFLSNTDERIGSDGTDMTFDVGGTQRMVIEADGNIGMGTESATTPLYIFQDSTFSTLIRLDQNGTGDSAVHFTAGSSSFQVGIDNSDADFFKISSAGLGVNDFLTADPVSGDVGFPLSGVAIGTTTASAKLDVVANSSSSVAMVRLVQQGAGDSTLVYTLDGGQSWSMGIDNNDSDKFKINSDTSLTTASDLTIDTAGFVGIGTNTPLTRLHIYDNSNLTSILSLEQDGIGDVGVVFNLSGEELWIMGVDNDDENRFKINNSSAMSSGGDITIDTSGNVGIGVTVATDTLTIGGDLTLSRTSNESGYTGVINIQGARSAGGTNYSTINFDNLDSNSGGINYTGARIASQNEAGTGTGDLRFSTFDGTTLNEALRIDNEGSGYTFTSQQSFVQLATDDQFIFNVDGGDVFEFSDEKWLIRVNSTITTASTFEIQQNGTGDASMEFQAGGTEWIMGVDNSSADRFKINEGTELTTSSPHLSLEQGGNTGLGLSNPAFQLELSTNSAAKPTSTFWTITSSRKIKKFISDSDNDVSLKIMNDLQVRRFKYKEDYVKKHKIKNNNFKYGFIAEEVDEIFDDDRIVMKSVTRKNDKGEDIIDETPQLDMDQILYHAFGAIKRLSEKVDKLEEQLKNK